MSTAREDKRKRSQRNHGWLRLFIEKNDQELSQEAKIAVLRALIKECQKRGVERITQRARAKLRWWTHISTTVATLRIICVAFIVVYLLPAAFLILRTRKVASGFLHQLVLLYIFLAIAFIIMEFMMIVFFHVQRSSLIAFAYALDFMFVILLIAVAPFLAGYRAYAYLATRDLIGIIVMNEAANIDAIESFHRSYKCCGFNTLDDWWSGTFFNDTLLLSDENLKISNSFRWMDYCSYRTSFGRCRAPHFCCESIGCEKVNFKEPIILHDIMTTIKRNASLGEFKYRSVLGSLSSVPGVYQKPCVLAIAEDWDEHASTVIMWLVILGLLTAIMTFLIIVILLYNSGQGAILLASHVRSPCHCSIVWAFKQLDRKGSATKTDCMEDTADFSIVEAIKNFNIDGDMTPPDI
ncbi:hypothetical protein Q1695_016387 [Nippostrongylus brasiliensis]|nr:hypothetical protein Q1695_016387 [Nippostrongylus brasiliensis]